MAWNPLTGSPELVWSRFDGNDFESVHSRWDVDQWAAPEVLTWNNSDDQEPDLSFAPEGTARVSFREDGRVLVIERPVGGVWSPPENLADGFHPVLVQAPSIWVAYKQGRLERRTAVLVAQPQTG